MLGEVVHLALVRDFLAIMRVGQTQTHADRLLKTTGKQKRSKCGKIHLDLYGVELVRRNDRTFEFGEFDRAVPGSKLA